MTATTGDDEDDYDDDFEEDYHEDEEERVDDYSVCDPASRKPRVLTGKCLTCVFRPGNVMRLRPGRLRSMVANALAAGTWIICHHTLPYHPHNPGWRAVCRGFYDAHGHQSQMLRIAHRLGGVQFVDLPVNPTTEPPKGSSG